MKTTIALFLLSVSSSSVLSITASANNADELNSNLRHTSNIKLLEDTSQQCNALGDKCKKDSDCDKGGFGPCNKCGTDKGTRYYKKCYLEPPPTRKPTPSPTPPTCNALGDKCKKDSDCAQGGVNPCNKCGTDKGTRYYKKCYLEPPPTRTTPKPTVKPTSPPGLCGKQCRHDKDCQGQKGTFNTCTKCSRGSKAKKIGTMNQCYDPHAEDTGKFETEEEVLIESDKDEDKVEWGKAANWTRKAAEKTVDGTKKAAQATANGTKKAAEATKDWGKK
eukprot:720969_1